MLWFDSSTAAWEIHYENDNSSEKTGKLEHVQS